MKTRKIIKYCALTGSILMGIAAIWGTYWALALQSEGNLIIIKILRYEDDDSHVGTKKLFLVHSMIKDTHGFEEEYTFKTDTPIKPGLTRKYYQLHGLGITRTNDTISGDWYYRWAMPVWAFLGTIILFVMFLILNRRDFPRNFIFITAALALLFCSVIYLIPLSRTISISSFVIDQRYNNQFEKDNPGLREQLLRELELKREGTTEGLNPSIATFSESGGRHWVQCDVIAREAGLEGQRPCYQI